MKKLISLALALVLILSLSTVAFAAEGDENDYKDMLDKGTTFKKDYVVNHGTAPAETFDFKIKYVSFEDNEGTKKEVDSHPTVTLGDAVFSSALSETGTADVSVAITNYENVALGVYTYEITEVVPEIKTAGTTYNTTPVYLVVTILNDETTENHYVAAIHYRTASGSKTDKITNQYDAGSLTVGKEITGNMADMSKKFTFTITFNAPTGTEIRGNIASNNQAGSWNGLTYTIKLGDGETVTLSNIPAGTTYTVTEDNENYVSDNGVFSDTNKKIAANDADTVTFTNTLTATVDTGISMDSMPYILLLAVAAMGLAVLFTRKRMMREF